MTTEEFEELKEIINAFKTSDQITAIVIGIALCILLLVVAFEIARLAKLKKWRNEYKATLTEEQIKAIKNLKRFE